MTPPAVTAAAVADALERAVVPGRAEASAWFFKTGPGQYGEGDRFIGVTVPEQRRIAGAFRTLPLDQLDELVNSPIHEHRLTAIHIAVLQFTAALKSSDEGTQRAIVDWYLGAIARERVNNWDIVDSSAPSILGGWLANRPRDLLVRLASSDNLWERRIAMIATLGFIMRGDASTTVELLPRYLDSREDLLQKATGWMLREIGKRVDVGILLDTLDQFAARMPRTMLSYATEHLSPDERAHYRAVRP